MSLKTFVKVSNIDNLSDARLCAGMMVDVLGFCIDEKSDRYVSAQLYKEITDWVSGPLYCGETGKTSPDKIKLLLENFNINMIETEEINHIQELSTFGFDLIYKDVLYSEKDIEGLQSRITQATRFAKFIIIKSTNKELSEKIESELSTLTLDNLIRAFNINEENLDDSILNKFNGIELESTPEDRPGYKDYDSIMDILELLEDDN